MGAAAETRYTQSQGLSIAYQDTGTGVPLVWIPGFTSHLELQRELPCWNGLIERMERFARFVTFDKRGTGLSDRSLGVGTLEDRMDDIRAVYDACGLDRAAIVAVSEAGPLSVLFAATFPERVSHLVVYGSFAHNPLPNEAREASVAEIASKWGTGLLDGLVVQHGGPAARDALARFERYSCTPTMAAQKHRADSDLDVRAVLPTVKVPTLVLHNRGDPFIPRFTSREIADGVPGAKLVVLPGDFHASWRPHDYDRIVEELEEFITGTHSAEVVDRVLTTVLFSDIVDSTRRAAELGDRRWHETLDEHDRLVRAELVRQRGREVKTTGDGFLATFDGPGRAISCGMAMVRAAATLDLELRVGLHTGECEVRGDDVAGIAVHIGSRVAQLAAPGEVLVTSTVRDLVAGSNIAFEDRGVRRLKGVPGEWSLLAVRAES